MVRPATLPPTPLRRMPRHDTRIPHLYTAVLDQRPGCAEAGVTEEGVARYWDEVLSEAQEVGGGVWIGG